MSNKSLALLLAGVLVAVAPAAMAASDAGQPKPRPAHGTMATPAAVENFNAKREVAYENNTYGYGVKSKSVDKSASGDQVNEIPAKERVYEYKRGNATPRVVYETR